MYTLLLDAFRGLRSDRSRSSRPVRGPALPMPHAPRVARPTLGQAMADRVHHAAPTLRSILRERAARPPLPPHLAAILANAPEVEPEFARRPRPTRATLATPFHRIAAKVRVYNPRPAIATAIRATPRVVASWGERLRRAVSEIHAWLAFDTAPPRADAARH